MENKLTKKRGMSAIIVTLLLVMLTVVLVGVVWGVINSMVHKQISSSDACYNGLSSLVTLNSKYSCYNSSARQVQFSLGIGDVSLDGVVVSITNNVTGSESFKIKNQSSQISNLENYSHGDIVQLPGANSGETYYYNWTVSSAPESIIISPVREGVTCSVSDSITSLSDCSQLY